MRLFSARRLPDIQKNLSLCCFCLAESVLTYQPAAPFLAKLFHLLIYFLGVNSNIHSRSFSCPEDMTVHWVIVLSQQDFHSKKLLCSHIQQLNWHTSAFPSCENIFKKLNYVWYIFSKKSNSAHCNDSDLRLLMC